MATPQDSSNNANDRDHSLERENAELRVRLRRAEADRDAYLKIVHQWAKAQITPEQLKEWDKIDEDSGRTILDVIEEVEKLGK